MLEKATDCRKKIIDAISWVIFTRAERGGHTQQGAFSAHATFVSYARGQSAKVLPDIDYVFDTQQARPDI